MLHSFLIGARRPATQFSTRLPASLHAIAIRCLSSGNVSDGRSRISNVWVPTGGIDLKISESEGVANQLLFQTGFLRQTHAGVFQLLPLATQVQSKIEAVVEKHLNRIGASKLALSTFSTSTLWDKSGRWANSKDAIFGVRGRSQADFILSPTHEEEITSLVASTTDSYKQFPRRLYQIGRKYRDELRPRAGLLRTREFVMKDLYTFDRDTEAAQQTYEQVTAAYNGVFQELGVPFARCVADSGNMGGDLSHEYHYLHPSGEDTLIECKACNHVANEEVAKTTEHCAKCNSSNVKTSRAIEVGHTFHLGTRYTDILGPKFVLPRTDGASTQPVPAEMGCHGIGITRLIAAIAEMQHDQVGLNWPPVIAPFSIAIVYDHRAPSLSEAAEALYDRLHVLRRGRADVALPNDNDPQWEDKLSLIDPVLDDREASLPWRLKDADSTGYPITLVLGAGFRTTGKVEIQCRPLGMKTEMTIGPDFEVEILDIVWRVQQQQQQQQQETAQPADSDAG